jgi:hypothetical protein
VAGKAFILGTKIPSVGVGAAELVAIISKVAFGTVVLMPTCENPNFDAKQKMVMKIFFIILFY